MKRLGVMLGVLLGLAGVLPLMAGAQKPPKSTELTFSAKPTLVVFGKSTTLSGALRGSDKAGKTIEIQHLPSGSTTYVTIATKTTSTSGAFSHTLMPTKNTRYRAIAKTTPPQTSGEVHVNVAFRVSLRLSDYTPRRGQRVRFSGSVAPQHDGRIVYIQRRTSSGVFRTVARTRLEDAGSARSVFARRIRIYRDGVYRARVIRDADHATGTSATKTANVP